MAHWLANLAIHEAMVGLNDINNWFELKLSPVFRTDSFRDNDMVYRLPPDGRSNNTIWPSDRVCKDSQTTRTQTAGSPRLSVKAGDPIVLLYQENGHVTNIEANTGHLTAGIVQVFGMYNSTPTDTFQDIWNGTRNDASSVLLYTGKFDDGVCYQDNDTPKARQRKATNYRPHLDVEHNALWCGAGFRLPKDLQSKSVFTLYWVWNFDGVGFVERYTTCIDIDIV